MVVLRKRVPQIGVHPMEFHLGFTYYYYYISGIFWGPSLRLAHMLCRLVTASVHIRDFVSVLNLVERMNVLLAEYYTLADSRVSAQKCLHDIYERRKAGGFEHGAHERL